MAAYIKTLKDASRENIIYPRTKSEAVYRDDNTTSVEEALVHLESEVASLLESAGDMSEVKEYTEELISSSVADWAQNDETALDYVKNRPFYDSREIVKTEDVTVNTTAGIWGSVKVADSIDFDFNKIKTLTLSSNTGIELQDEPVSVVYDFGGYNLVTSDDSWPVVYFETAENADIVFEGQSEGAGLYIFVGDDSGEDVSFYYSFGYELGEVVQLDSKYIKDMYYELPNEKLVVAKDFRESQCDEEFSRIYFALDEILVEGKPYNVVFDGVEYLCTAWAATNRADEDCIYLGNKDIYNENSVDDEPFCLECSIYAQANIVIKPIGSHTLKIYYDTVDINKIDSKYIATPNWDQNDVDGEGYINNRTHWTEYKWQTKTFAEDVVLNFAGASTILDTFDLDLVEGEIYTVTWDGIEYECEAQRVWTSTYGEMLSISNDVFEIAKPLIRIFETHIRDKQWPLSEQIHTISVVGLGRVEEVHKIDPKYLPDDIGGVTSWNDLTDRPFGSEFTRERILKTSQIPMAPNDYYAGVKWGVYAGNDIVIHGDRQYLIVWNGTEYRCNSLYLNEALSIGNPSIVNLGDNTGEPFIIAISNPQNIFIYTNEDIESVDLKIYEEAESIQTIDSKYLPSGGCADWNEADENQNDYIKNRPFYENKEMVSIFKKHLDYNNYDGFIDGAVPIFPGKKYTIVIGEEEFKDVVFDSLVFANGQNLGAREGHINYDGNGNSLGFDIYRITPDSYHGGLSPEENDGICLNIKLYDSNNNRIQWDAFDVEIFTEQITDIKQMSGEFIKDGYYEESNEKVLIDTTSYRQNTRGFANLYSDYIKIDIEKDYAVVFDGATYGPCKLKTYAENKFYIGNLSMTDSSAEDNGEPFCIETVASYHGDDNGNNWWTYGPVIHFDLDDGINHHLILKEIGETIVHKIDPKYIPDDIGGGIQTPKSSDMTQLVGIDENGLAYASNVFNGIVLKDAGNGYEYIGEMYNGIFTTYCRCDHIEVTQAPNKTEYVVGDTFNPSGMVITAIAKDGTSRVVENYTYQNRIEDGMNSVMIQYVEMGMVYSTEVNISLREMDPALDLIDFDYTDNGDGTYTLTGWKQTLNGQPSDDMIIPSYKTIKM